MNRISEELLKDEAGIKNARLQNQSAMSQGFLPECSYGLSYWWKSTGQKASACNVRRKFRV